MNPDSAPTRDTTEGLTQIRDILFGSQSKQIETRLAELNQRIEVAISHLREEIRQQSEIHNTTLLASLHSLSSQTHEGFESRDRGFQSLRQEIQSSNHTLRDHIDQLQAQLTQEYVRLRQEQTAAIDAVSHRLDELSRIVTAQGEHARQTMTGRFHLARLLQEVAAKLTESIEDNAETGR